MCTVLALAAAYEEAITCATLDEKLGEGVNVLKSLAEAEAAPMYAFRADGVAHCAE